ncbi:MAG: hypothetical protein AAGA03_04070 [Planctomycetota bacterium]
MNRDAVRTNPYAPPVESVADEPTSTLNDPFAVLSEQSDPIRFAGKPSAAALRVFLSSYDETGLAAFATIQLILFALVILAIAVGFGMLAFFLLAILAALFVCTVVSTRWYRTRQFNDTYPGWRSAVEGSIDSSGVIVRTEGTSHHYRWDWFAGAVVGSNPGKPRVVVLMPALSRNHPLILEPHFFANPQDWQQLIDSTKSRRVTTRSDARFRPRSEAILRLIRQRDRPRTYEGIGVPFRGDIRVGELLRIAGAERPRPRRATMVVFGLCTAFLLGLSGLLTLVLSLQTDALVSVLLAILILIVGLGSLVRWLKKMNRPPNPDKLAYHLVGVACKDHITLDHSIAVFQSRWERFRFEQPDDQCITLTDDVENRFLVLREDLFESPQEFQQVVTFAQNACMRQDSFRLG